MRSIASSELKRKRIDTCKLIEAYLSWQSIYFEFKAKKRSFVRFLLPNQLALLAQGVNLSRIFYFFDSLSFKVVAWFNC